MESEKPEGGRPEVAAASEMSARLGIRRCLTRREGPGWFHCWSNKGISCQNYAGDTVGVANQTGAIVELDNGVVRWVDIDDIRFNVDGGA